MAKGPSSLFSRCHLPRWCDCFSGRHAVRPTGVGKRALFRHPRFVRNGTGSGRVGSSPRVLPLGLPAAFGASRPSWRSLSHPPLPTGSARPAQHFTFEGSQSLWESHVFGIANRSSHRIISFLYSQETAHKNLGVFMGLGWWVRMEEEKTPRMSNNPSEQYRPAPGTQGGSG